MTMMDLRPAPLEDWLRDYYFTAEIDISSSGVEPYSMAELRTRLGIAADELDQVVFRDSQSCGADDLREAVARQFGDGNSAKVLVTNGSCEAEFLLMTTFLRPEDEIVVVDPAYHTLGALAEAIGCRVVPWRLQPERGFAPDMDRLRYLLSPTTRAIVVNFPHNPTGVSVDADTQRRIIDLAREFDAYLIWDAAFREITYDADPLDSPSRLYEKAITFGTLSKSFGLPGLRVGWGIMPEDLIKPCIRLRDYSTYALSPLVERVALHAVRGADVLLASRYEQAVKNLSLLDAWMQGHEGLVEWVRPSGGVCAFPRLPNARDVEEFCHRLMAEYRVLLVPGTCFGMPGHVRLGFGGATESFVEGMSRLSVMLTKGRYG
jgi:capreomycidine synthase